MAFQVQKKRWPKWVATGALVALAYIGYAFSIPYVGAYELRLASRLACNRYIQESRSTSYDPSTATWLRDFIGASHRTGAKLTPDNYSFVIDDSSDALNFVCTAKLAYDLHTPWPFTDLIGISAKPFRTVHKSTVEMKMLRRF